jgi:hypothetical protein
VARSRGGVGCLVVFVVLLLIVCGGVVFVDRVARSRAEKQIADGIGDDLRTKGTPAASQSVSIDGFPFLTQVYRGRYEGGVVKLTRLQTENVTIERVDLRLTDVRIPRDVLSGKPAHDITAKRIVGTGTVLVSELARRTNLPGLTLTAAGTGVRATAPLRLPVIGDVTVTASVTPKLAGNTLTFDVRDVQAAGISIPQSAVSQLTAALGTKIELDLPFAVQLERVTAKSGKLLVTGSAANVPLVN